MILQMQSAMTGGMKPRSRIRTFLTFGGTAVVLCLLLWSITRRTSKFDSGYRVIMGTFARMVVVADSQKTAAAAVDTAFERIAEIEQQFSTYQTDSQISRVNRKAAVEPVKVSKAVFELLEKAKRFSELTGGAFDITVKPLIDCWQHAGQAGIEPNDAQFDQTLSAVGYEKLILDANTMCVQFAANDMKIDLGGIAKGYGIDEAVQILRESEGVFGAMVDIGGDIRCFGKAPGKQRSWRIGLQDPNVAADDMQTAPLAVLEMHDAAVTTSGDYRRYSLVEDKRHSHIIDPRTGRSAERLASVTIIAPKAVDADAIATAVSVLGKEKGLELIESLDNVEAILIDENDRSKMIFSSGAKKLLAE